MGRGLLFCIDYIRSLRDAGGLHVTLNAGFQNADLKVSVDHPKRVSGAFRKLKCSSGASLSRVGLSWLKPY